MKHEIGTYRILANQIGNYIEAPLSPDSAEFENGKKYYIVGVRYGCDVMYHAKDFDKKGKARLAMFSSYDSAMKLRNKLDSLTGAHRYYVTGITLGEYAD